MQIQNNIRTKERTDMIKRGESSPSMKTYVKGYMNILFPLKILKRVLFRPYLGKWYPYIDVHSPGYENQLSLLYGKIELEFLNKKLCCSCYKELDIDASLDTGVPMALCKDCSLRRHYGYWICLQKVIINIFKCNENNEDEEIGFQTNICENLLKPRCNFPLAFERVNPCLKNHAIGVIILTGNNLEVIIGTLDTIKYQMMWRGGIFGLIFGYSNKILNLEMLNHILRIFIKQLNQIIKEYSFHIKTIFNDNLEKVNICKTRLRASFNKSESLLEKDRKIINEWFFLNFLGFYTNYDAKKLLITLIEPSFRLMEYVIKSIYKILNPNLELLDIIEIYKTFTPYSFELRTYFENNLNDEFNKEDISDMLRYLRKTCEYDINSIILDIFDRVKAVNFRHIVDKLKINEILCSLGSYIVINTDFSKDISFIQLNDLIGCKIQ